MRLDDDAQIQSSRLKKRAAHHKHLLFFFFGANGYLGFLLFQICQL